MGEGIHVRVAGGRGTTQECARRAHPPGSVPPAARRVRGSARRAARPGHRTCGTGARSAPRAVQIVDWVERKVKINDVVHPPWDVQAPAGGGWAGGGRGVRGRPEGRGPARHMQQLFPFPVPARASEPAGREQVRQGRTQGPQPHPDAPSDRPTHLAARSVQTSSGGRDRSACANDWMAALRSSTCALGWGRGEARLRIGIGTQPLAWLRAPAWACGGWPAR